MRKQFKLSLWGYNKEEVENWLKEMEERLKNLEKENLSLKERLKEIEKEKEKLKEQEKRMEELLLSAQRNADLIQENAREKAKLILEEAELKGREILRREEKELERIKREIGRLKDQRTTFLVRLRSLLQEHMELLKFHEEGESTEKKTSSGEEAIVLEE